MIFAWRLFMINPQEQTYFTLWTDQYLCNLPVDDSAFPLQKNPPQPTTN